MFVSFFILICDCIFNRESVSIVVLFLSCRQKTMHKHKQHSRALVYRTVFLFRLGMTIVSVGIIQLKSLFFSHSLVLFVWETNANRSHSRTYRFAEFRYSSIVVIRSTHHLFFVSLRFSCEVDCTEEIKFQIVFVNFWFDSSEEEKTENSEFR